MVAMTSQSLKQYIVFILGGTLGAMVKVIICFFLTSVLGIHYMVALLGGELINVLVNYVWHRTVTFRVGGGVLRQFFCFLLLSSIMVVLSMALVFAVKEYLLDVLGNLTVRGMELNYLVAIVGVTFLVSLINYLVSRKWIFVENAPSVACPQSLLQEDPAHESAMISRR
jgi:putative flippase GtrA